MNKYTHIVEKCSAFLRAGSSVRLKRHNYTMSEAYWKLRDGKGLVSSYDQKTLQLLSEMITLFRRRLGYPVRIDMVDYLRFGEERNSMLHNFELFRDIVGAGQNPEYMYENHYVVAVERVLKRRIGKNYLYLNSDEYIRFWNSLSLDDMQQELYKEDSIYAKELEWYDSLSDEEKKKTLPPGSGDGFFRDKIWQIRTDLEHRSSKNANISLRLNFIWDIPSITNEKHRNIINNNMNVIDRWVLFKNDIKQKKEAGVIVYKDRVTSHYANILSEIQMFDIKEFEDKKNSEE